MKLIYKMATKSFRLMVCLHLFYNHAGTAIPLPLSAIAFVLLESELFYVVHRYIHGLCYIIAINFFATETLNKYFIGDNTIYI